ncbi:hypothetical protein HY994_04685 [Candidatus Micrarchaeota archaeon]|nr:hypothetical protein [Candidatus Micrarchaeota archaeon]
MRRVVLLAVGLVLVGLWFFVQPVHVVQTPGTADLEKSGIAWVDGNATVAFFVVNASGTADVQGTLFSHPSPSNVLVFNDSDQNGFGRFSKSLAGLLSNESIPSGEVDARTLVRLDAMDPSVLVVVASAIPSGLLRDGLLSRLLDRGWVVLYSGLPFSMVRHDGRLVDNPDWNIQSAGLGLGFEKTGDGLSDYRLVARNGTLRRMDGWQVFQRGRGYLAVHPGLLDVSFADAEVAARVFSDMYLNASWLQRVFFSGNVSGIRTIFSPAFSGTPSHAVLWIRDSAGRRTRHSVALSMPALRVVHPSRMPFNRTLFVSVLANLTTAASFSLFMSNTSQEVARMPLGVFPVGPFWHSQPVPGPLAPGMYVLEVMGSDRVNAYSALEVYAYRVEVRYVDGASKTVYGRLWQGAHSAGGAKLIWKNQTVYADSEGNFKLPDPDMASGANRGFLDLGDGIRVPLDYEVQSSFLSTWPDRMLAASGLLLFLGAWHMARSRPLRIRLLASAPPRSHKIPLDVQKLDLVFESTNARFGWTRMPLHITEFCSGVISVLGDPTLVLTEDAARLFLLQAQDSGFLYVERGLSAPVGWFATKADAKAAFFNRHVADALTLAGWRFTRKKNRYTCHGYGCRFNLDADGPVGRVRIIGVKSAMDLCELEKYMANKARARR